MEEKFMRIFYPWLSYENVSDDQKIEFLKQSIKNRNGVIVFLLLIMFSCLSPFINDILSNI